MSKFIFFLYWICCSRIYNYWASYFYNKFICWLYVPLKYIHVHLYLLARKHSHCQAFRNYWAGGNRLMICLKGEDISICFWWFCLQHGCFFRFSFSFEIPLQQDWAWELVYSLDGYKCVCYIVFVLSNFAEGSWKLFLLDCCFVSW